MNVDTIVPLNLSFAEVETKEQPNAIGYHATKSLVVQKQLRR